MKFTLPGTKQRKILWGAWTLNTGFSVTQVVALALTYKSSHLITNGATANEAFTLRVLFLSLLGTIIMSSVLLFSSLVILLGKNLFKHGMSASFRVGCTVGANVTALIVLFYTGAICSYFVQRLEFEDDSLKNGYKISAVLSYISAVTHFVFGVTLFVYRDHVVPGDSAVSPEDSADLVGPGQSSSASVTALPPPAPYTYAEPVAAKPPASAFASSGQTANPWG